MSCGVGDALLREARLRRTSDLLVTNSRQEGYVFISSFECPLSTLSRHSRDVEKFSQARAVYLGTRLLA